MSKKNETKWPLAPRNRSRLDDAVRAAQIRGALFVGYSRFLIGKPVPVFAYPTYTSCAVRVVLFNKRRRIQK